MAAARVGLSFSGGRIYESVAAQIVRKNLPHSSARGNIIIEKQGNEVGYRNRTCSRNLTVYNSLNIYIYFFFPVVAVVVRQYCTPEVNDTRCRPCRRDDSAAPCDCRHEGGEMKMGRSARMERGIVFIRL